MKMNMMEIARLIQDPRNLPAIVLQTMPGIGQAIARMGAGQQIAYFASTLASMSGQLAIRAAVEKRDLTPDEVLQLIQHTKAVLNAARKLVQLHSAPAVDAGHLAENFTYDAPKPENQANGQQTA